MYPHDQADAISRDTLQVSLGQSRDPLFRRLPQKCQYFEIQTSLHLHRAGFRTRASRDTDHVSSDRDNDDERLFQA